MRGCAARSSRTKISRPHQVGLALPKCNSWQCHVGGGQIFRRSRTNPDDCIDISSIQQFCFQAVYLYSIQHSSAKAENSPGNLELHLFGTNNIHRRVTIYQECRARREDVLLSNSKAKLNESGSRSHRGWTMINCCSYRNPT